MKILRIIYDWPPPWQGLAPHPYELTVAQVKKGHEVFLFCGRWPKSGDLVSPKGVTIFPILREVLPGTIFFTSSVILFIKYLLFRKREKVDVIHSHGHFGIWIYVYRNILKKYFPWAEELKTPLVAHFHNTSYGRRKAFEDEKKDIKPLSKNLVWPLTEFSDRQAVKCASANIFVSTDTRDEAIKYYNAHSARCFVIESGVNTEIFKPVGDEEKEKSRKELDLDIYDKVILNHGVMVDRKNVHLLVEALVYLPKDYKLLLVGSGDGAYLAQINERIKALHLEDRVVIVGYTPYPQVPIAYQVADVFCLPSSWEGLPKVVMQGLACGVPCLVSGFKLSENINGLVYCENLEPQTIARQLMELVTNRPAVDVARILVQYSWEKRAEEINGIYEFALKNYF